MLIPSAWLSPSICPARKGRGNSHGNGRHNADQFCEKASAILAALRCVRPRDTVSEFEQRHHGYRDLIVASFDYDRFEQLPSVLARSFSGNGGGRIENQSQAGGSSGSRCAAMAASTSAAKSGSMVAVESAGNIAMHSEILRRGGSAGFNTAMAW